MHGYKNFYFESKIAFKSVLDKYNPIVSVKKNECDCVYKITLDFQNCKLILGFDYQDFQSRIVNPLSPDIEYHVFDILEIINPNYKIKNINKDNKHFSEFFETLSNLAYVIKKYLNNVIEGDFTWIEEYNIKKEKVLLSKLWSLENSDPIYQKFINGDLSWFVDMSKRIENE